MKTSALIGASVFALSVATPAMAQNQSTVVQETEGNEATVTQTGTGHTSFVEQLSDLGFGLATVEQEGESNGTTISQDGLRGGNLAFSFQFGTENTVSITQVGELQSGLAAVLQEADSEQGNATILQDGQAGGALVSEAFITQSGGLGNESTITQSGSFAEAQNVQVGNANFSAINDTTQFGAFILVTQIGDLNQSDVTSNSNSSFEVTQTGNSNISAVVMDGGGVPGLNVVRIDQTGNGNTSTVNPTDDGSGLVTNDQTAVIVLQEGDDNTSTVTVDGLFNEIDVDQLALGASSTISQSGSFNLAKVGQFTDAHVSIIAQTGDGNSATATQGTPPAP